MVSEIERITGVTFYGAGPFRVAWVRITPRVACELLTRNTRNRTPRHHLVDKYARLMRGGTWRPGLSMIQFGADGVLVNGQHRLMACVESGVGAEMFVAIGVDVSAHELR